MVCGSRGNGMTREEANVALDNGKSVYHKDTDMRFFAKVSVPSSPYAYLFEVNLRKGCVFLCGSNCLDGNWPDEGWELYGKEIESYEKTVILNENMPKGAVFFMPIPEDIKIEIKGDEITCKAKIDMRKAGIIKNIGDSNE